LTTIATTFVHAPPGASSARTALLPFPSMPWTAHEFAAGTASSGSTRSLQRSTADAVGRLGQADFVTDRVIGHPSCRLIGRYRSIPSCNRPAFLRLVRLLTVLIIAASAMYQTKSLVTYVSRSTESGHSVGHRVVRVLHRIVRRGFAVVSVDSSPTHEHQRAHCADRGRAGGDQRRPVTA
jgi:hypothetical protein